MENTNKKGLGIASMILGIIAASFLLFSFAMLAFLVLAVILGITGLFLAIFAKKCGQKTAGLVLNIVAVAGSLIIVPIILGIINDSKEQLIERKVDLYGRSADQAVEVYLLITGNNPSTFSDIEKYIEYSGADVVCSTKNLNKDMTIYLANCTVDGILVEEYTYGQRN